MAHRNTRRFIHHSQRKTNDRKSLRKLHTWLLQHGRSTNL